MDILKELEIERARREKEASTTSQKIAAGTNARAQAGKVKEQREINALRQKGADLQAQAIGQEQSAKRDLVKAGEEISRQQKLRAFSRDIYLEMLSQGQYDQHVLSGLGISEEAAKGIIARQNAARAASSGSSGKKKSTTPVVEEDLQESTQTQTKDLGQEAEELAAGAYAPASANAETIVNRLMGLTPKGVEEQKKTTGYKDAVKEATILETQKDQGVDRKTAETVYNLNAAAEKHGRSKVYETVLKYANSQDDIYTFAYKFLEKRAKTVEEKKPLGRLTETERAVMDLLRKDEQITASGKELIEAVLQNDLAVRVTEYRNYLSKLSDEDLAGQLETPTTDFGLQEAAAQSLAYSEYWKRNPDEYNVWILTETGEQTDTESIEERRQAAAALENKIAQIDGEIASLELVGSGDGTALGPGLHYTDPGKYKELKDERDYYQNILTQYRHGTQKNDDNFAKYATREDYAEKSANKDIKNPTLEEIDKFQVMAYGGMITDKETGETSIIKYTPKDYDIEAERKKLEIKDPLGFYLSYKDKSGARYDRYIYSANGSGERELNLEYINSQAKSQSWEQLTQPEIGMYYYILNDQGKEKAVEYLESLATELNYRATEEHREALKKAGAGDLALLNVLSIPANVLGGVVSFVDDMAHTLTGKEINPYNGAHSMQNFASNVRGETAGRIAEATNNVNLWGFGFDDAYQAVMSGVDSLAAAALGGPTAASVVLGTGAAASVARDLYERGATNEQILFGSVAAGAIEMITEKIGLDNLFKIKNAKTVKQWASNTLKQALPEAGEEMLSEISNTIVDAINMRSNSEWAKLVNENGGSVSKALVETAKQIFAAGAGGFLSGGMMGGVGSAPSYVSNQQTFAAEGRRMMALKLDNMVLQAGLEIGKNAKDSIGKQIGKLAGEIKSYMGHGKMTAANVRSLGRLKLEVAQYNYVRQQTVRGVQLSEIIRTVGKSGFYSANEVRNIYRDSKRGFVDALPAEAKASYDATKLNVTAQNAWLKMYDAGLRGEEVSFAVEGLTPAHAKAAYNFGAAAVDAAQNTLYNKTTNGGMNHGSENTHQIEIVQDVEETDATARVPEEVATELYYAGLNGARIETAVDMSTVQGEEMRRAVQAIYDRGAAERRELGTEQGVYRAGKGKVVNRTDHRAKAKTDVELLRKFARTHRLDVEIHEDGSIEGEAAYDVAAFKILMGESTEPVHFYHEVFENMQAIHPAAFDELRDAMVEHFLESGTFSQLNDEITQTMRRYDTNDYALARKEWVCSYAAKQMDTAAGRQAFAEWLDGHDHRTLGQKIADFFRKLLSAIKALCDGDDIGMEYKQQGRQVSAILQKTLDLLEQTRARQTSLRDGQTITIGGGKGGVRNSVGHDNKGNAYWHIESDKDIFKGITDKDDITDAAFNYLIHNRDTGIEVITNDNKKIKFIRVSAEEFTNSNESQELYNNDPENYLRKMRIIPSLQDIITFSYVNWHSPDHKAHKLFRERGFDNYRGKLRIDNVIFSYVVRVGKARFGDVFYDIKLEVDSILPHVKDASEIHESTSSNTKIPQNDSDVNNYSMRKSKKDSGKLRFAKGTATVEAEETEEKRTPSSADARLMGEHTARMDEVARNSGKLPRSTLGFHSTNAETIKRSGWARNLFSAEDRVLLNERIVEIMVRKNRGNAIWLRGNYYLFDVNNKIVIVGGTFEKPIIQYVMVLNAENATVAAKYKEVILDADYFTGKPAKMAGFYCDIIASHELTRNIYGYHRTDFNNVETAKKGAERFAIAPTGFKSYGYTQQQQDGSGVSAEDEETGTAKKLRFSKGAATVEAEEAEEQRTSPSADARLMGEHTARMDEKARNSGKLPQGERISRDIAVPRKVGGKKTMRWIRTFFESDVGEPDMVDPVAEDVLAEGMSYRIVGDRQALKKAEDFIGKNGYEQALQDFYFNADRMEDGVKFNFARGKETVVQGQLLLRAAAERKDYHNFKKLVVLLAEIETLAGQTVQAASMLKKMSGETKLFEVKRMVDKLNKKLAEGKYGEKGKTVVISMEEGDTTGDKVVISPQLLDRLIAAGNDGDAANEAVVNIYKDIAKQLPASFLDKWNTWRYLAMLFNPTTHFRNLLSNAAFVVPMEIKNSLQWAVECGVGAFKKDLERTTTLGWDRAAMKFAREDALKMQLSLKGGGKYNEQDTIDQYRDRFKSRWFNWIDKGSRLNSGLLEMEDWVFLKNHYAIALARYITANKLDVDAMTPEQLEAARQQAINHAKKATFRDASKMANALSSFSDKSPWANLLVESVMPFKKTPINILKRGVEYSPLGLISTIAYGSAQLKSGKISVGEYIAGLTAGLTGTGILALGFFLAKIGWLQGGFGRDDDDKENRAQDKLLRLQGVQEYSLTVGNVSYTLDWLAPTAIPLFMGVELYDALSDQSPNVWDKVWDAVIDGTDVIIETSMLNGLRGFIDGIKYDDNAILGIGGNSAVNYVSQAFPTVVGKLTGTIDGKRRINYVDKNSWVPEVLQDLGNKFLTKFWPWAKPVYYDEFGREKSNGNVFGRFVQNFFSPGYYSKIETGDLEEVIAELYATVEEPTPIPSTAAKYFKVDGETRYLKAEEYEVFSEKRGKMAYDIMHQAISSAEFEGLTAAQQATVLKEAYSYANAIAKTETVDCKLEEVTGEEWIYDAKAAQQALGLANILIYRQVANYDVTENKRINAIPMLRDAGLSEREAFTYAGDIRRGYRSGIDGTVYAASDIYLSITTGGNMYIEIYQDILDAYMRGGKSKKDANTAIKRGLSPHFKSAYLPASATEKSNIRRQMIMSGVYGTAQDVQDTLENWEKAED